MVEWIVSSSVLIAVVVLLRFLLKGKISLRLTCEKRTALLTTATTMTGSAKTIKERIALIVHKPKMALYTLIAVVVIAAIAVGCTFTGAKDQPDDPDDVVDQITEDDGGTENSGETENNGETEPLDDLSFMLRRLETLKPEDIRSFGDMEADADAIVPLINAEAQNVIDIGVDTSSMWRVTLYLSENQDELREQFSFSITNRKHIVDVSCFAADKESDTWINRSFRLKAPSLWNYIYSLYNSGSPIDEEALAIYGDILAERAQWTMEYHNINRVPEGFPAFTGFEIAELRLIDSFNHNGSGYLVYCWDAAFLTDDPDPGRYGWLQNEGPDEQGRIRNYEWCYYFVTKWITDSHPEYDFFNSSLYEQHEGSQLHAHAQILDRFTGEKIFLEGTSGKNRDTVYTRDGVSISIPDSFHHLIEAHRTSDTWCYGTVMNPTYYPDSQSMTEQTLFALYHTCDYWDSETGWIFSIRRYTGEEYGTLYLNSYSRQSVFAKDDTYYYCVLIPTDVQFENPETAAIIEELRDQQLAKVLDDMIERNGWETYTGE